MITYELIEGAYKSLKYQTPEREVENEEIMYMYKHRLKDISENVLGYLADSPIIITINVVFDIDSDLSNMTSSFLETSKSDISFQNNSVGDSILSSGSTPPSVKNKKGVIF